MNNLKEIRNKEKITQKQISEYLGLTQCTYSNYENGKTEPDIKTLIKIANYYNTSIDEICGHTTKGSINLGFLTPEQKKAHLILNALPENVFYYIYGKLEALAEQYKLNIGD